MSNISIIYKSILLYLLDQSSLALPSSIILDFFISKRFTDYFTLQSMIDQLKEGELIDSVSNQNTTSFFLTDKGKNTLTYMKDRISDDVRNQVADFLKQHDIKIRQSHDLVATFDKSGMGGYIVVLKIKEDDSVILDLSIHAASETIAKNICTNWKKNHERVYAMIMEGLLG